MSEESREHRKGGRPALEPEQKRGHIAAGRLNAEEFARVEEWRSRVKMRRGEYVRAALLNKLPPVVPEVNRQAWVELGRLASNLNQLQAAINGGWAKGTSVEVSELQGKVKELKEAVESLRGELLGQKG